MSPVMAAPAPKDPDPSLILPPEHDLTYSFRVRRRAKGNFKNLWQLMVKTPEAKDFIEVIDADMLETVIDRIRWIFEQDGL